MKLAPVLFAAALVAAACTPGFSGSDARTESAGTPSLGELPLAGITMVGAAEVHEKLAAAREKRIADLNAYTEAGLFPLNAWHTDATPCFKGGNGVYCAVGHLMFLDGHKDLVEQIAAADNFIRLADHPQNLASDWIAASGLTFEECALIQPEYDHWGRNPREEDRVPEVSKQLTQARLRAVVRKLRQDTPQALQIALERAFKPMGGHGYSMCDGRLPVLVANPDTGLMVVRLSVPGQPPAAWRKLAPGQSCRVEGAGILEWRPAQVPGSVAHAQ